MKTIQILLFFGILFVGSCEREIELNLDASSPKYVIDGNLSTETGESYVKITKNLNIDDTIQYPTISGAFVTITDNGLDKTDTLNESNPGYYVKYGLYGTEGHSYTLNVKIESEIFTALSTIPFSFKLDSLIQINPAEDYSMNFPGSEPLTTIQILPVYTNSTHTDKYYQFVVIKNRTTLNSVVARYELGSKKYSIPVPFFIEAKRNDLLRIDMQFVDKTVYNYLFGLGQNLSQFSTSPSNPSSNISNEALGVFNAHTTQKRFIIIK
jgi:hypothetical protein